MFVVRKGRTVILVATVILSPFFDVCDVRAQDAFESVTIGAAVTHQMSQSRLDAHWSASIGPAAHVEMPFYAGSVGLRLQLVAQRPLEESLPPYHALYNALEWGLPVHVASGLTVAPGLRVGIVYFRFDSDLEGETRFHRAEYELFGGLDLRVRQRVADRMSIYASAGVDAVYLSRRVRRAFVEAGIQVRLETPSWLREALE